MEAKNQDSKSYAQRLQQSEQEQSQEQVKFKVEEAKLQLQSDKIATQKKVSELNQKLNTLKNGYPLLPSEIVKTQAEIEGYEDGLKKLDELQKELGL